MTELPLFEAESTYSHRPCNLFTTKHNEIDTVVASSTRRAALKPLLLLRLEAFSERSFVMRKCTFLFNFIYCWAAWLVPPSPGAVPARKPCKKSLFSDLQLHFPAQRGGLRAMLDSFFVGFTLPFIALPLTVFNSETEMQFAQKKNVLFYVGTNYDGGLDGRCWISAHQSVHW
jgi:hypothetical protein